jgi:transcription elongation factor GreB
MSRMRTRPDESGKPGYITAEGYRRLEEEAGRLWTVERPKLVKSVATAAAEGDRSENAEYIYGKKKLAEIDRRLQFLGKRLEVLKIVDEPPEREDGQRSCYQIVGSDEVMIPPPTSPRPGPERKRISMDSPLAKALLRKCIGDEITVQRPKGEITYEIIEVTYGSGAL